MSDRRHISSAFCHAVVFALLLSVAGLETGCETGPIRALRGARHYASGSSALERSESEIAVLELERAAVLVPHASEIHNHLGLAYWSQGRLGAARLSFERALELDCENRAAEANLENLTRSNAGSSAASAEAAATIGGSEHGR